VHGDVRRNAFNTEKRSNGEHNGEEQLVRFRSAAAQFVGREKILLRHASSGPQTVFRGQLYGPDCPLNGSRGESVDAGTSRLAYELGTRVA